jgi:signal transduction histidine kinase
MLSHLGFGLGAVWAALTVWSLTSGLIRDESPVSRRVRGPVVVPAAAFLALTTVTLVLGARRGFVPTSGLAADLRVGQAAALLVTAGGVTWGLLRARRVQAFLARAVVRWFDTPGRQLRADLSDLLDDPGLVIAHQLDDGRFVDSDGAPLAPTASAGREITELRVADDGAVLLIHRAGALDSPVLVDGLTSAAGLALTNDRLRARTLDQLGALQSSQSRIIEAGDKERRRLEHDLHDGAQQRLVGILLGLRLLQSRAGSTDVQLQQAEAEVARAVEDLRALSHGLFPAVLADAGLAAALEALGEVRQVTVEAVPRRRLPAMVEATAYLVIDRASSVSPVTVDATQIGDLLTVRVRRHGPATRDSTWDRVVALGGSLTIEPDQDPTIQTLVVVIPGAG